MEKFKIQVSVPALEDHDEIMGYILFELGEQSGATKLDKLIRAKISSLQIMPKSCPIYQQSKQHETVYFIRAKNYKILFHVKGKTVHILRIVHSRRHLPNLFK